MKTLVIHPKDFTTRFLSEIYSGKDWTVISDNISHGKLKKQIKDHDRIIMLGHGTESGLIGHGRFIINSTLVYLLRDKPESIYIWCNADVFVKKYDLKGFYTWMIISEVEEAILYCVNFKDSSEIYNSNMAFAKTIKESVDMKPGDMCVYVKTNYASDDSSVVWFNNGNIYFK